MPRYSDMPVGLSVRAKGSFLGRLSETLDVSMPLWTQQEKKGSSGRVNSNMVFFFFFLFQIVLYSNHKAVSHRSPARLRFAPASACIHIVGAHTSTGFFFFFFRLWLAHIVDLLASCTFVGRCYFARGSGVDALMYWCFTIYLKFWAIMYASNTANKTFFLSEVL